MNPTAPVRVRIATFADIPAIREVQKRNSIGELDPQAWRSRWEAYPFEEEFRGIPIGWVLETDRGSVVGVLENVHIAYELGGKRLKGVVASAWAVDSEYRGKSLQLMTTFLRQPGVDLALVLSASPTTSRVLSSMKVPRIPIPDYATPCFWAVRHRAFARASLRRKSIPGAALLAWPAGWALLVRDLYCLGPMRVPSGVRRVKELDIRFDGFCQAVNAGQTCLRAVRNKAVLEWRFRTELRRGSAAIVIAEQGPELRGYAVMVRREGSDLGMALFDVADLQAAGDDPSTIRDLLLGCIHVGWEEGADAIKFVTGTPAKRAPAVALQPQTYQMSLWQLYYKTSNPQLSTELSTADKWDISLFDTY